MVGEQDTLRLHFDEDAPTADLSQTFGQLPFVTTSSANEQEVVVTVPEAAAVLPDLLSVAAEANQRVRSIDIEEPNLEAVFLHLTGRALRE